MWCGAVNCKSKVHNAHSHKGDVPVSLVHPVSAVLVQANTHPTVDGF